MRTLMQSLEQHVMRVTGATNGLGKQLAHELAAAGATVLLQSSVAEPPRRTESQKSCLCTPGVPAQYVHTGASRAHTLKQHSWT